METSPDRRTQRHRWRALGRCEDPTGLGVLPAKKAAQSGAVAASLIEVGTSSWPAGARV